MVTGVGLVTPVGTDAVSSWNAIIKGACGVRSVIFPELANIPCTVGATVNTDELDLKAQRVLSSARAQDARFMAMAMIAADEAISDAGFKSSNFEPTRAGVAIGSGIGSAVEEVTTAMEQTSKSLRKLSPFFVPRLLLNLAAGHVSIAHNLQGPNHACSTACATGAHAIGDASRFIEYGDADIMVAGGSEATMNALSFAGFSRLKALSNQPNPRLASRPFDKDRDGFVMGEGAGIVVLEELEHAKKRGAVIYGEIGGYGLSADAHHITSPSSDGRGAIGSMRLALKNASMNAEDIDYVNAHATSTPIGDAIEARAIHSIFGGNKRQVAVSSTKGAIGHLLGAAGSVEAILTLLSVKYGIVPPTLNLFESDLPADVSQGLHFVANDSQERKLRSAISNSFGFGGTNASLLFKRFH